EEMPTYVDSLERMEQLTDENQQPEFNSTASLEQTDKGMIEIDDISYQYEANATPVIDHLSLSIEQGEKIAILGKSGTGKSKILKLLAGIIEPTSGTIHGKDVKIEQAYVGSILSVLNQKAHLFHTTIANNLRMANPHATEEDMIQALEQAQIMDLIRTLPDGIYTQMDEMGKRFSGGERQRIAFARVLLQQTPIILMDEPTTGLDPNTERALLNTMLTAAKEKTIIWVTHHLTGVEKM